MVIAVMLLYIYINICIYIHIYTRINFPSFVTSSSRSSLLRLGVDTQPEPAESVLAVWQRWRTQTEEFICWELLTTLTLKWQSNAPWRKLRFFFFFFLLHRTVVKQMQACADANSPALNNIKLLALPSSNPRSTLPQLHLKLHITIAAGEDPSLQWHDSQVRGKRQKTKKKKRFGGHTKNYSSTWMDIQHFQ